MRKKSLKETNPYLKNPALRKALINQSIPSSTAVEGVLTKYDKLNKSAEKNSSPLSVNPQCPTNNRHEYILHLFIITIHP
ncbi:hypothetical protein BMS3Abin06_02588 [bacterium BMS3Abin06]|nr:hypothetical protein BMS3Abin06_02588 [bacterium BMS3Abin06]